MTLIAPAPAPAAPPVGAPAPAPPGAVAPRDAAPAPRRRRPTVRALPWLLAAALFALYAALSVQRHLRLETTGWDLGIFEQGVRGYASGGWPYSRLRGLNLLGDHFSPVMAAFAPFYRVWPSPVTLLVGQAALLAVSVVPVARLALRRFGPGTAVVVGLAHGLAWGLQEAVTFDVHEVAFAVPLLAWSAENLALRRWGRAVAWALPLLLVKEDLPLTVAAVGLYVAVHGRRRLGLATVASAVGVAAVALLVVVPALNPHGRYGYAASVATGAGPTSGWAMKAATVVMLLVPTAFVALRSPLVLLVLPTLAWRFASSNPNYWGVEFHYSAVLVPVLSVAAVDGLHRLRRSPRTVAVRQRLHTSVLAATVLVTLALAGGQPLSRLAQPDFWRPDARSVAVAGLLRLVPDGAAVAATNGLTPQLTSRCDVWSFPMAPGVAAPEWVVADVAVPSWPSAATETVDQVRRLVGTGGYRVVAREAGAVVLHRAASGG